MALLADVLDPAEPATVVENGHVRVQRHPMRPGPCAAGTAGALRRRLDDKDYRPGLWRLVSPAGDTPMGTQVSEQ